MWLTPRPSRPADPLVEIDLADAALAVARGDADFQRAIRLVTGEVATTEALSALVGARGADVGGAKARVEGAKADVAKSKVDYDRARLLVARAVSGDELTSAKNAYTNAQACWRAGSEAALGQAVAAQKAAESQLLAQQVLSEGSVDANPQVAAARAALNTAKLDLQRTAIRAPIDGVVSRRQVQVGQRVRPMRS